MNHLDYIHELIETQEVEKIWDMHVRKMQEYGFEWIIYGFTNFRRRNNLGNPEDFNVLSNHDHQYITAFIENGMYGYAPMLRWAVENTGSCSWGIIGKWQNEGSLSEKENEFIEFNKTFGIKAGYTVSFRSTTDRGKGAVALTARPDIEQAEIDAIWAEHGRIIELYNNLTHLKLLTLPFQTVQTRALTKRQREALQWVGDGKTTQDIAILMGLTKATVEKHLRLARETLAVETTAQAVLKASLQNQIFHFV